MSRGNRGNNADAHLERQNIGREVVVTGEASGWAGGWMVASRVTHNH
jgi:hypothetical protein